MQVIIYNVDELYNKSNKKMFEFVNDWSEKKMYWLFVYIWFF